jgi:hypothetical protein
LRIRRRRLLGAAETAEEIGARGVQEVVAVETGDTVDEIEAVGRPFDSLQLDEQLTLAGERLLAADAVDRPVSRRRDDPGARVGRQPVIVPAVERGREGVLHRILGELELAAENAGEDRDGAPPLVAEDRFELLYADTSAARITTGRDRSQEPGTV